MIDLAFFKNYIEAMCVYQKKWDSNCVCVCNYKLYTQACVYFEWQYERKAYLNYSKYSKVHIVIEIW